MNCAIWCVLTHVYLWKFHHIKDGEHIHHLRKFPCMLCHHSHTLTFPLFPDSHWNHYRKHINGIMKYIVLVFCCCSSFFHLALLFWDSPMLVSISIGHSFLLENSFHSMHIPQFVYLFTSWWTFGLFWLTNKTYERYV